MQLLDFSKALEIAPEYTGSEKKKTMILDGKKYLVKFPNPNNTRKEFYKKVIEGKYKEILTVAYKKLNKK